MQPPAGTYRELFKEGLELLSKQRGITAQKQSYIQHYRVLLDNPEYKFGRPEMIVGHASSNETLHPFFQ